MPTAPLIHTLLAVAIIAATLTITAWQIANYAARRWATDPEQPSLFTNNRTTENDSEVA